MRTALSMLLSLLTLAVGVTAPLQQFRVKDHLDHQWTDELIHFSIDAESRAADVLLTDAEGQPVPCQFTNLRHDAKTGKLTGEAWTVVTVEPGEEVVLSLQPGKPNTTTPLKIEKTPQGYLLANERIEALLPIWPGAMDTPVSLSDVPGPVAAIRAPGQPWLSKGGWKDGDKLPQVKEAVTRIIEQGPARITVEQRLTLTDGRWYTATVQLAHRQDMILVTEESDIDAPQSGFQLDMTADLHTNRVLWYDTHFRKSHAGKSRTITPVLGDEQEASTVFRLCPWSFWWNQDQAAYAGFYREDGNALVGVMALRPSRWTPAGGWSGGFNRTSMPVTIGPKGAVRVQFPFAARTEETAVTAMHREWALTAGDPKTFLEEKNSHRFRKQVIKYSEFPLDEVKEYGFDFTPAQPDVRRPHVVCTREDIERVRRQYKEGVPEVVAIFNAARRSLAQHSGLASEGAVLQGSPHLIQPMMEAYTASDDPAYGRMLAAVVRGLAPAMKATFLESPPRPIIGSFGPWFSKQVVDLLNVYDLIAGTGVLAPEEERMARNMLVFGAHFLSHPDFWNAEVGIYSGLPNMNSSIILPRGLAGLFLDGHPRAAEWLKGAEDELKHEITDWVAPGGAWVECPGYQTASLDGIFLLATGIRNVHGRDYFTTPSLKVTMDYAYFMLTPPDLRFPYQGKPVMVRPSIGDTPVASTNCYAGWMAAATAKSDPAYSAVQQYYWKAMGGNFARDGRASGLLLAQVDYTLPSQPPADLSRAYHGFGGIMRTSWTDPRASYLIHRTGPHGIHYHDDANSLHYYAKGVPLCVDFGNQYQPIHRGEASYHNRVSFTLAPSTTTYHHRGVTQDFRTLPRVIDYSYGVVTADQGQKNHRHVLMVKSDDALGANYLVIRDMMRNIQPRQAHYWNLWCLSTGWDGIRPQDTLPGNPEGGDAFDDVVVVEKEKPQILVGNTVHFPGQFGVDLDVHILSPAKFTLDTDYWEFQSRAFVIDGFRNVHEEQFGVRIPMKGPADDYLAVLYPRAEGQHAANITSLADGAATRVRHMEGEDIILVSPGKAVTVDENGVRLQGEIAFARKYANGAIRLAVVKGDDALAAIGDVSVRSSSSVSVELKDGALRGEASGEAHQIMIKAPVTLVGKPVLVDGKQATVQWNGRELIMTLPEGSHTFTVGA